MRIGLRHFLYKIKEEATDRCGCDQGSQTPKPVLLQCPLHVDQRRTMMTKIARTDLGVTTEDDASVSHPQAARYVAEFMPQTGLLGQFRDIELEPDPGENDHERIGLAAIE